MHDPFAAAPFDQDRGEERSPAQVARTAITGVAAVAFFAVAANGLGIVLQLLGVMPLLPW